MPPALEDKKELILHWACYTSINPKIILALIEQQSGLLSNPDADFAAPLIGLSDEQGFDAQVEDLVTKLSQRFYAYKQWQDSQVTAITSKYTSTAISNQASSNSSTAATAALVSVFKKRNKLAVDQDIVNHSNDDLTVFFGHF